MQEKKITVQICQGTACFVLGASELLAAIDDIPEEWKEFIEFECSPCLQLCERRQELGRMPYITVNGQPYADVTRERLLDILRHEMEDVQ